MSDAPGGGDRDRDDSSSAAPTRVAVPRAAAGGGGDTSRSIAGGASLPSATTSREALHLQEIDRTRVFVRIVAAFVAVTGVCLVAIPGDPLAEGLLWGGMAIAGAAAGWLEWRLRRPEAYRVGQVLVFGYACIAGGFAGIYFFGFFSPAVALMPVGIYFFSPGQSWRGALSVYLVVAVLQAAIMLGIVFGAIPDRGLVRGEHLSAVQQVVIVALLEAVYLATFLIGRATRRATLEAIDLHEAAVRQVALRDALLAEARADLERALRAGGLGRYSDQTIGSFRLGAVLGRGGMGEVYEAVHTGTHEPAAVKLLGTAFLSDVEQVRRFYREARVVAALQVPNVVRVLEVGGPDAPLPYIAMERLHGSDLADILRKRRRVSVRFLVDLLRQVGKGLEAARAAGVVHRDLKPRNLYFAEPVWKILDFGVSKLLDGATVTHENVIGTPGYMAPEQAMGDAVSHRTDLFALGAVAYRALTGRPAFSGGSVSETVYQVVHAMPPRPSETVQVPPEVDWVVAVALAKRPEDRFGSAADFADALEAAGAGQADPELAARAEKLLEKLPWSTRPASGSED